MQAIFATASAKFVREPQNRSKMKKIAIHLFWLGFLLIQFGFFPAIQPAAVSYDAFGKPQFDVFETDLKEKAFEILDAKCNLCHRKQNPFKIFSQKNMNKHAPKIHKQVFVLRRMPKGDSIKLTIEEYQTLKKWLQSQNIF